MDLQGLLNTSFGVRLGVFLGRIMPPGLGYALGNSLSGRIVKNKTMPIVEAVRLNQWVVRGQNLSIQEMEQAVRAVFQHAGHCFVDLYHNLTNPEAINSFFPETPAIRQFIERSQGKGQGTFVAILHLSNFDLAVLSLAQRGLQAQILTYSRPTASYQAQNRLRSHSGLEVTPIDNRALYRAIQRLKAGGMVITAIDRPIDQTAEKIPFFGQPAALPTGHIRMALKADVPVMVAVPLLQDDGKYSIFFSDPIVMRHLANPLEEIRVNARAILEIAEDLIRQHPDQWLMYYPVWPGLAQPA